MISSLSQNLKSEKGLSLLETLIAVFIITIGLISSLSLVVYTTSQSNNLKERVIAYYLAQEGLELVRNYRDSEWLAGNNLFAPSYAMNANRNAGNNYYRVDYTGLIATGSTVNDRRLYIDANGFYSHQATGILTPYSRIIRKNVIAAMGVNGATIVSEVSWGNGKSVKLESKLYNWRGL